jgi:hypothetical protein
LKGLVDAADNHHKVLAENQKLFNEVQELKGISLRDYEFIGTIFYGGLRFSSLMTVTRQYQSLLSCQAISSLSRWESDYG